MLLPNCPGAKLSGAKLSVFIRFLYKVLKSKKQQKIITFFQNVEKKVSRNFLLLHLCARQGTHTRHNLTYAQNVDNKSSKKFNQIKLNVSFLIVGEKVKKKSIFFLYPCPTGHTDTLKLNNLCKKC